MSILNLTLRDIFWRIIGSPIFGLCWIVMRFEKMKYFKLIVWILIVAVCMAFHMIVIPKTVKKCKPFVSSVEMVYKDGHLYWRNKGDKQIIHQTF